MCWEPWIICLIRKDPENHLVLSPLSIGRRKTKNEKKNRSMDWKNNKKESFLAASLFLSLLVILHNHRRGDWIPLISLNWWEFPNHNVIEWNSIKFHGIPSYWMRLMTFHVFELSTFFKVLNGIQCYWRLSNDIEWNPVKLYGISCF